MRECDETDCEYPISMRSEDENVHVFVTVPSSDATGSECLRILVLNIERPFLMVTPDSMFLTNEIELMNFLF